MPQNGEINKEFGVYKTLCCGAEIVIAKRLTFPDCPNHPKLAAEWKRVEDTTIRHISDSLPQKKNPAA
jgi:hypothetical protein